MNYIKLTNFDNNLINQIFTYNILQEEEEEEKEKKEDKQNELLL